MAPDTIVINKNKFIAITISVFLFSLLLLTLVLYSIKTPNKPAENRIIEIYEFNVSGPVNLTELENYINKPDLTNKISNQLERTKNTETPLQKTDAGLPNEKFNNGNPESSTGDPSKEINESKGLISETTISTSTGIGINLTGRVIESQPILSKDTKEEGKVVVEITVDSSGKVIKANPNGRGTTTSSSALKEKARQTALTTKFNASELEEQKGTVTIIFSF